MTAKLTECQLLLIENVLVEQDNAGAHGNPDTGRAISLELSSALFRGRNSHDIESRVNAALRRLRLLERRVDDGQDRLGLLRSLDLAGRSLLLHCARRGVVEFSDLFSMHRTAEAPVDDGQDADGAKNEERGPVEIRWKRIGQVLMFEPANPLDCMADRRRSGAAPTKRNR